MAAKALYSGADLGRIYNLYRDEVAKTANYTIVPADNGTLFSNAGAASAITFTLPALARKTVLAFLVQADQTVTIASAAGDDMVVMGDASADSISFNIPGSRLGAFCRVFANADATKWVVELYTQAGFTVAT